jgi:hypothetical protein
VRTDSTILFQDPITKEDVLVNEMVKCPAISSCRKTMYFSQTASLWCQEVNCICLPLLSQSKCKTDSIGRSVVVRNWGHYWRREDVYTGGKIDNAKTNFPLTFFSLCAVYKWAGWARVISAILSGPASTQKPSLPPHLPFTSAHQTASVASVLTSGNASQHHFHFNYNLY